MWCAHCQSDVAAELSATDRRAHCAACGGELIVPASAPPTTRTRHALQLLERWSRPDLLDPYNTVGGPTADTDSATRRSHDEPTATAAPVDEAPPTADSLVDDEITVPPSEEPDMTAPTESTVPLHTAYAQAVPPHPQYTAPPQSFAAQQSPAESTNVREAIHADPGTNWVAIAGQLLAYAGVAVLTIGTTLALWGHFAGEPNHVPTGWLVASAGQMLLFLGVVTLISSGMEQAARDLNQRFERVSAKVDRVEHALHRPPATVSYSPPTPAHVPRDRAAA